MDTGEEDDKVLAVASGDDMFKDVRELDDMPAHYLKRMEFFWKNYKELVPQKSTEGRGWFPRKDAEEYIETGINYYKKRFGADNT